MDSWLRGVLAKFYVFHLCKIRRSEIHAIILPFSNPQISSVFFSDTTANEYLHVEKAVPFFFIPETQEKSVPELDEICNVIDEVVNFARQINLEMDNDDSQELLNSHNQTPTIH
ncbi:hypothetical protein TNCV_3330091 [Trichonephila clavipes]|nr:hypothetical protein TNCV_3330091 [Trichonephila clavipes]